MERNYTLQEVREAERAAFRAGIVYADLNTRPAPIAEEERRRYPIKRDGARVVTLNYGPGYPALRVKVEGGQFYSQNGVGGDWVHQVDRVTPENIRILAELLENPTEEVDV